MTTSNTNINESPKLGEGIFLVKDVSQILHLPASKVRRWLTEFWDNKFGKNRGMYSFGDTRNKAVNFHTLIEFFVFSQLRREGISSQQIQKYYKKLEKILNTKYPFAHSRISTDGKDIWYDMFDNLIKVDGKSQFDFKPILKTFLTNIEFDNKCLAERYFPLSGSKNVVVDPKHQFGQPTISGTNIKTQTIYSLYKGGEPKKNISNLYNISLKKVQDAIYFHKNAA